MPPDLLERSRQVAESPIGTTESFPIPGVTTLIRSEPHVWGYDDSGALVKGCFQSGGVYVPTGHETVIAPERSGPSRLEITVGVLTVLSLAVGTAATLSAWKKKKR